LLSFVWLVSFWFSNRDQITLHRAVFHRAPTDIVYTECNGGRPNIFRKMAIPDNVSWAARVEIIGILNRVLFCVIFIVQRD
jgi:hypothetical protein